MGIHNVCDAAADADYIAADAGAVVEDMALLPWQQRFLNMIAEEGAFDDLQGLYEALSVGGEMSGEFNVFSMLPKQWLDGLLDLLDAYFESLNPDPQGGLVDSDHQGFRVFWDKLQEYTLTNPALGVLASFRVKQNLLLKFHEDRPGDDVLADLRRTLSGEAGMGALSLVSHLTEEEQNDLRTSLENGTVDGVRRCMMEFLIDEFLALMQENSVASACLPGIQETCRQLFITDDLNEWQGRLLECLGTYDAQCRHFLSILLIDGPMQEQLMNSLSSKALSILLQECSEQCVYSFVPEMFQQTLPQIFQDEDKRVEAVRLLMAGEGLPIAETYDLFARFTAAVTGAVTADGGSLPDAFSALMGGFAGKFPGDFQGLIADHLLMKSPAFLIWIQLRRELKDLLLAAAREANSRGEGLMDLLLSVSQSADTDQPKLEDMALQHMGMILAIFADSDPAALETRRQFREMIGDAGNGQLEIQPEMLRQLNYIPDNLVEFRWQFAELFMEAILQVLMEQAAQAAQTEQAAQQIAAASGDQLAEFLAERLPAVAERPPAVAPSVLASLRRALITSATGTLAYAALETERYAFPVGLITATNVVTTALTYLTERITGHRFGFAGTAAMRFAFIVAAASAFVADPLVRAIVLAQMAATLIEGVARY
jgi:hypothetical protein